MFIGVGGGPVLQISPAFPIVHSLVELVAEQLELSRELLFLALTDSFTPYFFGHLALQLFTAATWYPDATTSNFMMDPFTSISTATRSSAQPMDAHALFK